MTAQHGLRGFAPGSGQLGRPPGAGPRGWVSASFSADGTHAVTTFGEKGWVWDLRSERPSFIALEDVRAGSASASFWALTRRMPHGVVRRNGACVGFAGRATSFRHPRLPLSCGRPSATRRRLAPMAHTLSRRRPLNCGYGICASIRRLRRPPEGSGCALVRLQSAATARTCSQWARTRHGYGICVESSRAFSTSIMTIPHRRRSALTAHTWLPRPKDGTAHVSGPEQAEQRRCPQGPRVHRRGVRDRVSSP